MDGRNRACMIESDEEDEDGNLSANESEPSMGENDEEFILEDEEDDEDEEEDNEHQFGEEDEDSENIEEDDEKYEDNSNSISAKSKISSEGDIVCLTEDSSSIQIEDKDETFNDSEKTKKQSRGRKAKPTVNKKSEINLKSRSKVQRKVSKNRNNYVFSDEDSSSSSSDCDNSKNNSTNKKFARQPTPKCDNILKDIAASKKNSTNPPEKRLLRGSKTITSSPNKSDLVELNDQSENIKDVNKYEPQEVESETDSAIIDPLLVKKEEKIKLEIKEEIVSDESKEEIKPLTAEDESVDLMDCDENLEIVRLDRGNKLSECNIQNKRKRTKRKNEEDDDPDYSYKTKKKSTIPSTKNNRNKQNKTCSPTETLSKIGETTLKSSIQKRGRPPKNKVLPVAEINKESENNLLSDEGLTLDNKSIVGTPESQKNVLDVNLQPIVSLVPCDSIIAQYTATGLNRRPSPNTPRRRGRPPKVKNAESPQNSQKQSALSAHAIESTINHNFDVLSDNSLKTEDGITFIVDQENEFDSNDILCLQQLDRPTPAISVHASASMTAKETNSFIADYLIAHRKVFDDSFFQNILPALSEILMLCMDEFTELLLRIKKSENFTSEELRQQEVTLAIKSFCTMVSTYSEKFFPNFNSVIYKINQNNTKKGLIITLIFFIANALCNKAPKFKGQIHSMRKMLMCICQIRKINSPLFLAVLITPETVFNDELKLLVKILLVLQKKNVLAIPNIALPETSSFDSIGNICELMVSSSTDCSLSVNDSTWKHNDIVTQVMKIIQDNKQDDFQTIRENLSHILCLLKPNNSASNSERSFESNPISSLTQRDKNQDESLKQDQVGGLDSFFESYLKSTRNSNDEVKTELDVDYEVTVLPQNYETETSKPTLPMSADNIDTAVKVEEVDCDGNLIDFSQSTVNAESSTALTGRNSFVPEDPLSF